MNEKQSKRGFVSSDMWTRLITFETSMYTISLWSWRSLYINNTGKLYIWSRNILYCTIDNWNFRFVSWCIIFSCIIICGINLLEIVWCFLTYPPVSSNMALENPPCMHHFPFKASMVIADVQLPWWMNLGLPKDCQWRVEVRPFGLVPHPTSEIPENVDPENVIACPSQFPQTITPYWWLPPIHHG